MSDQSKKYMPILFNYHIACQDLDIAFSEGKITREEYERNVTGLLSLAIAEIEEIKAVGVYYPIESMLN